MKQLLHVPARNPLTFLFHNPRNPVLNKGYNIITKIDMHLHSLFKGIVYHTAVKFGVELKLAVHADYRQCMMHMETKKGSLKQSYFAAVLYSVSTEHTCTQT